MRLRRRRRPEALRAPARAFDDLVSVLERAKAALADAVPGTRLPGRPLAEALWAFEAGLRQVEQRMASWRAPEVETEWIAAEAGRAEARRLAERLRIGSAEPRGFEELIGVVGELLAPLEAFEAAALRVRELRR